MSDFVVVLLIGRNLAHLSLIGRKSDKLGKTFRTPNNFVPLLLFKEGIL